MRRDLTAGPVAKTMLLFSLPLIAGDMLQQLYNVADTLIVGRFLGAAALGAVGSAYTLMTFLPPSCWAWPWAAGRCSPFALGRATCPG